MDDPDDFYAELVGDEHLPAHQQAEYLEACDIIRAMEEAGASRD